MRAANALGAIRSDKEGSQERESVREERGEGVS